MMNTSWCLLLRVSVWFPLLLLLACGGGGGAGSGVAASGADKTTIASPTVTSTYYQIRLVMSSTSDINMLNLSNFASILSYKTVSTPAAPGASGWYPKTGQLFLNQPTSAASANTSIQLVIDFAFPTAVTGADMNLALVKGALNNTTVSVYGVSSLGATTLIKQFSNQANSATLAITSADFALANLSTQTVVTPVIPKMVWAIYYPWYNADVWNEGNLSDYPVDPGGATYYYDDSQASTHDTAIAEAQSHGVDGFVTSWAGPTSNYDMGFQTLLTEADKLNFNVSVYYETIETPARTPANIVSDLVYLLKNYATHSSFYKFQGKPVVFIYASNLVSDTSMWGDIFTQVRAAGVDAYFIGMGCFATDLDVFDGVHEYAISALQLNLAVPPTIAGYDNTCSQNTRSYHLLSAAHTRKFWVAPVEPGYDNSLLGAATTNVVSRTGGQYFTDNFNAAVGSTPDWVMITSWNEWRENTEIEPGHLYGTQYVDLTKTYSASWKAMP